MEQKATANPAGVAEKGNLDEITRNTST